MLRKNKMTVKEIEKLIKDGEKINIEFKESKSALTRDIFDTVCAFNNIQQEVPYFYKQGMNCFFSFLKLFQKYDIIKSIKDNKKEYFWSRSFLVLSVGGASIEIIKKYIQGQGGEDEDS